MERYAAARNLAVIMPAVNHSFYCNEIHGERYWDYVSEELPRIMRRFLRISGRPEDTFVAGLSMGGMQTINIGLCECLDLFSAFGAFSAAPTSYPAASVAKKLEAFPEEDRIRFFYNICGTEDGTAYASAAAAAKDLPEYSGRVDETNFLWQELPGGHDFNIWNLGLYNFVRILDSVRVEDE